jgi:hypothetical protein
MIFHTWEIRILVIDILFNKIDDFDFSIVGVITKLYNSGKILLVKVIFFFL